MKTKIVLYSFILSICIMLADLWVIYEQRAEAVDKKQQSTTTVELQHVAENITTISATMIDEQITTASKNVPIKQFVTSVDDCDSQTFYTVTPDEREMLARLVFLESSICSLDCQKAVVSVVFNRLEAGKWGNTLTDVIYYPNAFTPAKYIFSTTPDKTAYEAVDYVLKYGPTVPCYVRYFRADYDFKWTGYTNYTTVDNVYFGYLVDWEKGAW